MQNDKTRRPAHGAKARRAELDMAAVGRGMAQALFSLPQWQSAGAVLAFAAMPDEPDTAEILRRALADGKRPAAAPRAEQNRDGLGGDTGIAPAAARGVRHSGAARRPARHPTRRDTPRRWPLSPAWPPAATGSGWGAAAGIMTDFWHTIRERGCCSAPRPCCWTSCPATTGDAPLCGPRIF